MNHFLQVCLIGIAGIVVTGCQTIGKSSAPALGFRFESDAAAHIFYQGILDRTELPLQSKKTFLNTPILVVEQVNQVSGASIASRAAAKADADGDLEITESEARAFAGSVDEP